MHTTRLFIVCLVKNNLKKLKNNFVSKKPAAKKPA